MLPFEKKIASIPAKGGQTKGVYLPNTLVKRVYQDMQQQVLDGQEEVSFAKVIKSIVRRYYAFQDKRDLVVEEKDFEEPEHDEDFADAA